MTISEIKINHAAKTLFSSDSGTFEPDTGRIAISSASIEIPDTEPETLPGTFAIITFSFHSNASPRQAEAAVKISEVEAGAKADTYDITGQALKMQLL